MYEEERAKAIRTAAPEETRAMTITAAGGRPMFLGRFFVVVGGVVLCFFLNR